MRVSQAPEQEDAFPWCEELVQRELESWLPPPRRRLELVRWNPGRRRRSAWPLYAAMALAVALALTVTSTGSFDPRDWLRAAASVVRQVAGPPAAVRSPAGVAPVAAVPVGTSRPVAASTPVPAPTAAPSPSPRGGPGARPPAPPGPPGVSVTVRSGPGAGDTSQGVSVANDPRGAGGMTGSVGEGPVHASGTIDGDGVRGCVGVYTAQAGSNICGQVNLPVRLPVPALPAPFVPDVAPSP